MREKRVFVDIGIGQRTARVRPGERLHETKGLPLGKGRVAGERVDSGEIAGEEVVDAFEIEIGAHLIAVPAAHVGNGLNGLNPLGVGVARAEIVPAEHQYVRVVLLDDSLRRRRRVGFAGLAVGKVDQARIPDGGGAEYLRIVAGHIIGGHFSVAGVLLGAACTAAFKIDSRKPV